MDRFLADAENILKASLGVARCGERPTEMVILVGVQGHIRMLAECDWPLHSIRVEQGARSAYKVTSHANAIVVEGEQVGRKCRIEEAIHAVVRPPCFAPFLVSEAATERNSPKLLQGSVLPARGLPVEEASAA